tara:strand:- start:522 stop:770 length:249 start_codon:yes stop_codon:yes gene_type:complete
MIKAGTVCFVSSRGHDGIFNPIFDSTGMTELSEDLKSPCIKTWNCEIENLVAVDVNVTKIKNLYGNPLQRIIIWVNKKDITK